MISGADISAYVLGTTANPLLEFHVELEASKPFNKATLDQFLGSTTHYRYLSIQSQVEEPTAEFVAKLSLTKGYELSQNRGRVLTRLSEVILDKNKLDYLQVLPLLSKAKVYLHITVFG